MQHVYIKYGLPALFLFYCSIVWAVDTTVFLEAVKDQDYPLVKELLEKGVDVNAQGERGQSALMWAILKSDRQLAEYLIAQGADVNHESSHPVISGKNMTVIDCAVMTGDTLLLDFLRTCGANLHATNARGWNSFCYAIQKGDRNFISYFINQGVTLPENQQKMLMALILAKETTGSDKGLVRFMIEKGFEFNPDDAGFSQYLSRFTKEKPEDALAYLQRRNKQIEEERIEQALLDSILSLTPEQRERDPFFCYEISDVWVVSVEDGISETRKKVTKIPRVVVSGATHPDGYKTYYPENGLVNPVEVGVWTVLYIVCILSVFFRTYPAKKRGNGMVFPYSPVHPPLSVIYFIYPFIGF
ncbi:MAG: ankyrin repeat domain-containing protein [Tannerellaceae bacterium]|nr:ankyrin repeat domain-containing protein [Tannerellaceae bacterium]